MRNRRNTTHNPLNSPPQHAPNTIHNPLRERPTHMAQSFNATLDEFLDQTVNLGTPLDTKLSLVPECETRGTIISVTPRKYFNEDEGEWRANINVMFLCTDPKIKEETELDEPKAQLTIRLDTAKSWDGNGNPPLESGKNKNIGLGRFLTALKINDGRKWKWSQFIHEDLWIRTAKPYNEQSPYADVAAVASDEDGVKRPTRTARR